MFDVWYVPHGHHGPDLYKRQLKVFLVLNIKYLQRGALQIRPYQDQEFSSFDMNYINILSNSDWKDSILGDSKLQKLASSLALPNRKIFKHGTRGNDCKTVTIDWLRIMPLFLYETHSMFDIHIISVKRLIFKNLIDTGSSAENHRRRWSWIFIIYETPWYHCTKCSHVYPMDQL